MSFKPKTEATFFMEDVWSVLSSFVKVVKVLKYLPNTFLANKNMFKEQYGNVPIK